MSIYTRTGDRGKTSLFSGERVPKHHRRVEAYGDVDELGSVIGCLVAALPETLAESRRQLLDIQSDLFVIGAWLAAEEDAPLRETLTPLSDGRTAFLEEAVDAMTGELPPLKGFILPGGHPGGALAHVARTVCRRAERRVTALGVPSLERELAYLNRLSDYLFVLARFANHSAGVADVAWKP